MKKDLEKSTEECHDATSLVSQGGCGRQAYRVSVMHQSMHMQL